MTEQEITQDEYWGRLDTPEGVHVLTYTAWPEDKYHARVVFADTPDVTHCILREKGGAKG
jgi:hypothetical protein